MGGDGREVEQPHDRFFKGLLAEPGVADALLRERLPAEVVARFGRDEPEMVPGTFVDPALSETQTDQLFRVRTTDGSPAYVYCLVEHKSWPDGRVAEQLLRYLTRIWSSIARETPDLPLLPPIVPLVVYHGARPWPGPRRFSERLDASDELRRLVLDFPYFVFDVGPVPDETLSAHPALRAGLVGMKYATRLSKQVQAFPRVLLEVRSLSAEARELEMVYILRTYRNVDEETFWKAVRTVMPERENELQESLALRSGRPSGGRRARPRGGQRAGAGREAFSRRFSDTALARFPRRPRSGWPAPTSASLTFGQTEPWKRRRSTRCFSTPRTESVRADPDGGGCDESAPYEQDETIAIVGLGYVGLPVALAFDARYV